MLLLVSVVVIVVVIAFEDFLREFDFEDSLFFFESIELVPFNFRKLFSQFLEVLKFVGCCLCISVVIVNTSMKKMS